MYKLPESMLCKKLKVTVIGAGGNGSFLIEELISIDTCLRMLDPLCGLDVTVYDRGIVSYANLVRQKFFPTQVGTNKAEACIFNANNLHGKSWKYVADNFVPDEWCGGEDYKSCDVLISCLDRPSTRYAISKMRLSRPILWLDLGTNNRAGQIVLGELGSGRKLPNICDLYDYSGLSDEDALIKSCSAQESIARQDIGVNAMCARYGAQILSNLLRYGSIDVHGIHFDTRTLEAIPIHVSDADWALYGYVVS